MGYKWRNVTSNWKMNPIPDSKNAKNDPLFSFQSLEDKHTDFLFLSVLYFRTRT